MRPIDRILCPDHGRIAATFVLGVFCLVMLGISVETTAITALVIRGPAATGTATAEAAINMELALCACLWAGMAWGLAERRPEPCPCGSEVAGA